MKYVHLGILFALIVVAAAICGCASGPARPGPTVTPAAATAALSPTTVPAELTSGDLFNTGGPGWYEYRLTTDGGASDIRFDRTTAVIGGMTLDDVRTTLKTEMPDMVVVMDRYYDPATGRQVGSRQKATSAGTMISDPEVAAAYDRCRSGDVAGTFSGGDWPLSRSGAETVTAGGKSYATTKYSVGDGGGHGTVWVSEGVPVPVKVEAGASTWELTGWG